MKKNTLSKLIDDDGFYTPKPIQKRSSTDDHDDNTKNLRTSPQYRGRSIQSGENHGTTRTRREQNVPIALCVPVGNGSQLKFPSNWSVWIHNNASTKWDLGDYTRLLIITNVSELWKFLNNFNKLDYMNFQFFVMRGDITPRWEDPKNCDGGCASVRLQVTNKNLLSVWNDLCMFTVNEEICTTPDDITGVSFNLKENLTVLKIWNSNHKNDISKKLIHSLLDKYNLKPIYIYNGFK